MSGGSVHRRCPRRKRLLGSTRAGPGQISHRQVVLTGHRQQVVAPAQHPEFHREAALVQAAGQLQGLTLGAAVQQVFQQEHHPGRPPARGR